LVIEEVDNGLHPSRARLLLNMLKKESAERGVDILVTTHNPALLDELAREHLQDVVMAHRGGHQGTTTLVPLEDVSHLSKLFAWASLGEIVSSGRLADTVSQDGS
jgi:AAA15 family ATPase/GTPase